MSKKRNNSVNHPRFFPSNSTSQSTNSLNDLLDSIRTAIDKKDSDKLAELFEYAESQDLEERVTEWFQFDIFYRQFKYQDF
jgi:hypothetical protein